MTKFHSIAFRFISFAMFFLGIAMLMHRDVMAASLQANAVVEDSVVRLSDVVTGPFKDPALDDIVIAQAPAPGERSILTVQSVANIAYKNGAAIDNPAGLSRIYVQRLGVAVSQDVIEGRLLDELKALGFNGEFELRMQGRSVSFSVPVDTTPDVRVEGFQYDPRSGRFQARISPAVNLENVAGQTVYGQATPIVEVPVLAQRMGRRDVIGEDDVVWMSMPASRVGNDLATDVGDLVGMSPRRTLQSDQPIRLRDVQEPVIVTKNATVTMLVKVPGMTLTAVGRALEDGSMGSLVRVINSDTHQTVTAEVVGPNQVRAAISRSLVTAELAR